MGWLVWMVALAVDVALILTAKTPAYMMGVILPLFLAFCLYLWIPLVPHREEGKSTVRCPHCGAASITWKQKLFLKQGRTVICSDCQGQVGISNLNWINVGLMMVVFMLSLDKLHGPIRYGFLVFLILISTLVRLLFIPLVKK
jgi:predicted RNA-binding Zn-ribbon protein involved in translation (DUF1610 family)